MMILHITSIVLIFSRLAFADKTFGSLDGIEELLEKVLERNVELDRRLTHLEEENDILKEIINIRLEERLTQLENANDNKGHIAEKPRRCAKSKERGVRGVQANTSKSK